MPRAEEIIALWEDTLVKFEKGDLMALAPRLDWVMKLMAIERAMEQSPELEWDSPEVKVIDMFIAAWTTMVCTGRTKKAASRSSW